jgi:glycosyltransferase involved in cell wall biosynthesis
MERRAPSVYLEINPLSDRHLTGIARYTARLAMALKATGCDLHLFSGELEVQPPSALDWSHDQDLGRWARRLWNGRRNSLPTELDSALGVYPCGRPVERRFGFEVSVLHDLTPLLMPQNHADLTRVHFQHFFAVALLSSDSALCVSRSTRADAAWLTDFPPERTFVAPSGPSLCVERHLDARPTARRPDVGLVVSTLEPRKNAFFLLDWFLGSKALPREAELWWVGGLGWLVSRRQLRRYTRHPNRRVRLLGTVDDPALCRLYRTAGWSVYPTLYEGFGFPVLDALRHGTPVLAPRHSSIREFSHPDLHGFDPRDPASLDEAWLTMDGRSPTPDLTPLDAAYNWRRVAETLLELPRAAKPALAVA